MSTRVKWSDAPNWATVELQHKYDAFEFTFASAYEEGARAFNTELKKEFALAKAMWKVASQRPKIVKPIINPHIKDGVIPPLVTRFKPPQPQSTTQADRYNAGKAELSYILSAPSAMQGLAEVFAFGATKYSRDNWQRGFPKEKLVDSLLRHLLACQNGEVVDAESKLNHLDHVLWNALALADEYNGKRGQVNDLSRA